MVTILIPREPGILKSRWPAKLEGPRCHLRNYFPSEEKFYIHGEGSKWGRAEEAGAGGRGATELVCNKPDNLFYLTAAGSYSITHISLWHVLKHSMCKSVKVCFFGLCFVSDEKEKPDLF